MTTDQTPTPTRTSRRAADVALSLAVLAAELLLISYLATVTAALWGIDVTLRQAFFTIVLAIVVGSMATGRSRR